MSAFASGRVGACCVGGVSSQPPPTRPFPIPGTCCTVRGSHVGAWEEDLRRYLPPPPNVTEIDAELRRNCSLKRTCSPAPGAITCRLPASIWRLRLRHRPFGVAVARWAPGTGQATRFLSGWSFLIKLGTEPGGLDQRGSWQLASLPRSAPLRPSNPEQRYVAEPCFGRVQWLSGPRRWMNVSGTIRKDRHAHAQRKIDSGCCSSKSETRCKRWNEGLLLAATVIQRTPASLPITMHTWPVVEIISGESKTLLCSRAMPSNVYCAEAFVRLVACNVWLRVCFTPRLRTG
ncbi:hypothetical protein BT67DRAFT_63619 [Trichocladium antarcticum]|uniref:Uncharacterized protein n=1 Tax=Trichocladium antarcticum TaxID=1450529 RepID=A0AAN6UHM6_9PEZI|nr:hypothetical protein BT67DRAFT_63619 [Trichocladium antarcticum]